MGSTYSGFHSSRVPLMRSAFSLEWTQSSITDGGSGDFVTESSNYPVSTPEIKKFFRSRS